MATQSPNLGLTLPIGSENVSRQIINDNNLIIDGAVESNSEALAIVINGDTAPKAITSGQYLFIKNHTTLPTGGYHATANIANGAAVTSSNVAQDADGIANALNGNIASLKTRNIYAISLNSGWSANTYEVVKIGRVCILQVNGLKKSTTSSGWTQVGTFNENVIPSGRILGYFSCDSSLSAGKTTVAEVRVNIDGTFEVYSPQANEAYWGGFAYFCD